MKLQIVINLPTSSVQNTRLLEIQWFSWPSLRFYPDVIPPTYKDKPLTPVLQSELTCYKKEYASKYNFDFDRKRATWQSLNDKDKNDINDKNDKNDKKITKKDKKGQKRTKNDKKRQK